MGTFLETFFIKSWSPSPIIFKEINGKDSVKIVIESLEYVLKRCLGNDCKTDHICVLKTFQEVVNVKKFKYDSIKNITPLCLVDYNFELFSETAATV